MNLPRLIAGLVKAQNNFDCVAYASCFSETAIVFDEGKTYKGRTEIQHWIAEASEKYKIVMEPVEYKETGTTSILLAEISGTFDGSPVVLKYHFEITDGLIQSLEVKE